MKYYSGLAGMAFVLVLLAGTAQPAVKKNIEVTLQEKQVRDMTSSGLLLNFYVRIANMSGSRYFLTKYNCRVVIEQTEYLQMETALDQPISVEPKGETLIALPLKITYDLLFQAVRGMENAPKVGCQMIGLMIFADENRRQEKIPFAFAGEFPVFKDPEIIFSPVRIKDLTLGGSDLVLGVTFRNGNAFDLTADRILYKIELGGQAVAAGTIREQSPWPPESEKNYSFPLLLDFFELGGQLYPLLQQTDVEARISGEIDADTIWGRVKIPIEKSVKIPIGRGGCPNL
jgi:LEA14-like dessication related protein